MQLVCMLAPDLAKRGWSCRIITPYHNQRVLLACMLDVARGQGWLAGAKDVSVEIIESMQGTYLCMCALRSSLKT
jgi:hypothetical protein